ncbi:metallophosphoesterase [soil metagenome]
MRLNKVVMKTQLYDLIGDIHGHQDKLIALLNRLDYRKAENTWKHLEGRKVIFLGDYIDRGPKIREVLHTVRGMVDSGDALAIMGNHELNAVLYATPRVGGGHLREHEAKNVKQHAATLKAFEHHEAEWAEWLHWMKRLPMFLELGELRAVHAAWYDEHIEFLRNKSLLDHDFLHAVGTKNTREYEAVEFALKGPELDLPVGIIYRDKENTERYKIRARWWNIAEAETLGDLVMPQPMAELTEPVGDLHRINLANYPKEAPPVFVGHYWMPPNALKQPLAENVAVVDFSAGIGTAPLYGYRWDGRPELKPEHFVTYDENNALNP